MAPATIKDELDRLAGAGYLQREQSGARCSSGPTRAIPFSGNPFHRAQHLGIDGWLSSHDRPGAHRGGVHPGRLRRGPRLGIIDLLMWATPSAGCWRARARGGAKINRKIRIMIVSPGNSRPSATCSWAAELEDRLGGGHGREGTDRGGARPQFVKAAPVCAALAACGIDEVLVHTAAFRCQHVAGVFRGDGHPAPGLHLGLGGTSHGAMTGRMLEAVERCSWPRGRTRAGRRRHELDPGRGAGGGQAAHPGGPRGGGLRSFNRACRGSEPCAHGPCGKHPVLPHADGGGEPGGGGVRDAGDAGAAGTAGGPGETDAPSTGRCACC